MPTERNKSTKRHNVDFKDCANSDCRQFRVSVGMILRGLYVVDSIEVTRLAHNKHYVNYGDKCNDVNRLRRFVLFCGHFSDCSSISFLTWPVVAAALSRCGDSTYLAKSHSIVLAVGAA